MSRIPGVVEIVEQEVIDSASVPGQVEVAHVWRRITDDMSNLESILLRIGKRCELLRAWQHKRVITSIDIGWTLDHYELLLEWMKALKKYVLATAEKGFPGFEEGSGI